MVVVSVVSIPLGMSVSMPFSSPEQKKMLKFKASGAEV
jgi:hypothetical protein